ncbi:restriction endonuclease subunit S [Aeromonas mytilicola]|uniref:Restriction endonuclease subunit S n=1 Tax=Aeromonas caviae TaxID=648 RepID=A0AA42VAD0_AERCA|nr:restriction endonuclease subunit S [Aeromonas caviae]MDH1897329.1 restriction endonuclease subunit S [Aeromonas caviae]
MAEQIMQETAGKAIPAGYKQTEVGVIPEDWGVVCLGDIGQSLIGLTYSPKNVSDDGVLVLRSSNVQNGRLAYEDSVFVKMELPDRVMVKEGDILICVRNGSRQLIGKCALIDKDAQGFAFGAFMSVYRTEASGFVFYQFQSDVIQLQINETMGATINQITNRDLSGFRIMIPNSNLEQTAIANVLSDSDALIDALEQLIAKKQAIKSATMQQLLTGRTRLPQFALREDGTPKGTKPSELGEIPEDWEVGAIGDSCRTYSGGTPSTSNKNFYGGGIKWITSSDLNQGVIHDVAGRITDAGLNGSSAKLVEAHTLLIALYGATAGVCAITRISAAINQAVLAIVPAEHNSEYLFYWFTRHKEVIIETYTQGGQPNLSGDIVRSIKLAFPPVNEQTAIATILSDMDAEIQALEQRLGKTLQIKQGMMQELLTGKTRLIKPSKEVIHE